MTTEDVVLEAIIAGVRAAGREADLRWADPQMAQDQEHDIAHIMRTTTDGALQRAGMSAAWLCDEGELQQFHGQLREGDIVLIADALDGYRMYLRHIPNWSIALGAGRWSSGVVVPLIGVVFHPPTQELFLGI